MNFRRTFAKAASSALILLLVVAVGLSPAFSIPARAAEQNSEEEANSWRYKNGQLDDQAAYEEVSGQTVESEQQDPAEQELTEQELLGAGSPETPEIPEALGLSGLYWKINYSSSQTFYLSGGTMKGIDVSYWQKDINWASVKAAGVDFAIIRVGYGKSGQDSYFAKNVQGAIANGIPYGVYLYSYARSEADVAAEAAWTMQLLNGYYPDLPVYYDLEDSSILTASKKNRDRITNWGRIFCSTLNSNGYKAGVYANYNWFTNYINGDQLKAEGYDLWLAQYPLPGNGQEKTYSSYGYGDKYSTWQCSSSGSVSGIKGKVDVNLLVEPYSAMQDFMEYKTIPGERAVPEAEMRICTAVKGKKGPGQGFKTNGTAFAVKDPVTVCGKANGHLKLTDGGWIPENSVVKPETPWAFDPETGVLLSYEDKVLTEQWANISGKRYYVDSEGKALTGRQTIGEEEFWFGEDGALEVNKFKDIEGSSYYLGADGRKVKNGVIPIGAYYYGFAKNGALLRGTDYWYGCCQYSFDGQGRAYLNRSKTKKKAKLYSSPGLGKVGSLKKGKSFYVLRTSGKWSQMDNGCWIKTSYIKKTMVLPNYVPSNNVSYKAKMKKRTAAYSGPTSSYIKKKTLRKNAKVTVVGSYGGWAKLSKGYWVPISRLKQ